MQNITVKGTLGANPESKEFKGQEVVSFSLAANSGFGDQKTTTWYRVSFWGKQGEVIAKNVTKGEQLIVNGTLNVREYEKNGTKAYSLDVRGSTFDFCGSKKQTKDETEDAGF